MSPREHGDDLTYLGPQECAVVLQHHEADALLAIMEKAIDDGIEPGIGLHIGAAVRACQQIVEQRNIADPPHNRWSRIAGVVWRRSPLRGSEQA